MAEKKQAKAQTAAINSELDQLRDIVFGAAKADIDSQLHALKNSMNDGFKKAEQALQSNMQIMQEKLDDGLKDLNALLRENDNRHEDKESELNAYADKLSSELEMADANNRQENDELHSRIDKEVSALTKKYDAKFAEALDKLNQVTHELSNSKTDRKTLAKLLATVATNLETDEDS